MSQDNTTIVIASAARTPVGSFSGSLASLPAHELGSVAIKAALDRAGVQPGDINEVVLGQVLTAGQGQNPARQASIAAGIPVDAPAWGVNQVCGSGLRAVAIGMQQILTGSSSIVIAGDHVKGADFPVAASFTNDSGRVIKTVDVTPDYIVLDLTKGTSSVQDGPVQHAAPGGGVAPQQSLNNIKLPDSLASDDANHLSALASFKIVATGSPPTETDLAFLGRRRQAGGDQAIHLLLDGFELPSPVLESVDLHLRLP